MTDADVYNQTFPSAFAPLATKHRRLRALIKQTKDRAERELYRTSQQAIVATLESLLAHNAIERCPVDVLLELYLELQYAIIASATPYQEASLRLHQSACFAALLAAIDQHGISLESLGLSAQSDAKDRVERVAMLCQILHYESRRAPAPAQHADLHDACERSVELLWNELKPHLIQMTGARWVGSWTAGGYIEGGGPTSLRVGRAETLARIGFSYIWPDLLTLDIDPQGNVIGLLTTIAHRGISQDFKIHLGKNPARQAPIDPIDIADPAAAALEQHILDADCLEAVQAFIAERPKAEDRLILQRRLIDDPPSDNQAIAAELGAPWTANNVGVRFHRLKQKLQDYLRSLSIDGVG